MNQDTTDTIAAIATPPGRGGIGIVRISGPATRKISAALLGDIPAPRHATFRQFCDASGETVDEGLAIFFPAPNSYTGEDVLELHGHGGVVVQDRVLRAALAAGCRIARPGEFSERAFLNDRLDLAQAEAIADLIESGSETAAKAAMRSLRGEFSDAVNQLLEQLTELRMYVEAAIDFPEEEVDFLGDVEITQRVATVRTTFDVLRAAAGQGALLHDGLTVVIAGPPNAGKSSLLNALAGYAAAIVTDIPGTTRDLLRERLQVDGLPLHIVDTAGLREPGDAVEQEGVRRARAEIETADCALLVVDDTDSDQDVDALLKEFGALPVLVLRNKTDLSGTSTGLRSESPITLGISAKTGAGLDALRQQLKALAGYRPSGEGTFMARRRHLDALDRARQHLETGWQQLVEAKAGELMAEELRLAQQALGEVTGEFTSDDLLGRIFASFCIGK